MKLIDKNLSHKKLQIHVFAIFAFCFCVFIPLFISNNWFDGHDGIRFLCLFEQFKAGFMEGFLYPRWLPDNYGGYGYPDFVFYQPGFFYFLLPFSFILSDTLILFFFGLFLLLFIGALSVYFLVREYSNPFSAFLASLFFVITPYIYVNLYVRCDLAEYASMMLIPSCVLSFEKLRQSLKNNRREILFFIISSILMTILVYTHPFTAMFAFPVFLLYSLSPALEKDFRQTPQFFIFILLAIFAATALSAPYWLSAFLMKNYVNYKAALSNELQTQDHLLAFTQLFSRFWGFGGSLAGAGDQMSFQLGLPHFILAIFGFLFARSRFFRFVFFVYICSIFLLLDNPVNRIFWSKMPLLNMVQFPWRLFSLIAFLQILAIVPVFLRISQMNELRRCYFGIIMLLLSLIFYNQIFFMKSSEADTRIVLEQHRLGRKLIFGSYSSFNEFFPVYIKKHPDKARGNAEILEVISDKSRNTSIQTLSYSSSYKYSGVVSSEHGTILRVLQFYFPGFEVLVDGKSIIEKINVNDDGSFIFEVPAGEHLINIYYSGTPYDTHIFILALSGFMIAIFAAKQFLGIEREKMT